MCVCLFAVRTEVVNRHLGELSAKEYTTQNKNRHTYEKCFGRDHTYCDKIQCGGKMCFFFFIPFYASKSIEIILYLNQLI